MTLTELRYIIAVAREKHFGRAADACFVSQPTLSVAIRKLEDELGVVIFERGPKDVKITPIGERLIEQAQKILEETAALKYIAQSAKDQLAEPLHLGVIFTIGPYLLPQLVPALHKKAAAMSLQIEENFTEELSFLLKRGELDVAILALPFDEPGILTEPLYDEPFQVVIPRGHAWEKKKCIKPEELTQENLLLLGTKNCLRAQVLQACSQSSDVQSGLGQKSREGSSLETLRHMVASGTGITVLPCTSLRQSDTLLTILSFCKPIPSRRVVMAWRKSFPRPHAIKALREAILACNLPCVHWVKRATA